MSSAFTWVDYLGAAASVTALMGFMWLGARNLYKGIRQIEKVVNGELTHNGGGSMKDMVREARDEARRASVDASAARVAAEYAHQRVGAIETQLESQQRTDVEIAKQVGAVQAHLDTHIREAEPLLRLVRDDTRLRRAAEG